MSVSPKPAGSSKVRRSDRILMTIPILVAGFDATGGEFSEQTQTLVVNRDGARIALKHPAAGDDIIHIVNLDTMREADFRLVGRVTGPEAEVPEWGVECLSEDVNIWGIEYVVRAAPEDWSIHALLECRACGNRFFWPITVVELDVLRSSGIIQNHCEPCGQPTYWMFADPSRRVREFAATEPVTPPPPPARPERRTARRWVVKLPVLVRSSKGVEEIAKTENASAFAFAAYLTMDLMLGEIVTVVCPYTSGGNNLERQAELRRRVPTSPGSKALYAFRYLP
jgi:hypothetical protein